MQNLSPEDGKGVQGTRPLLKAFLKPNIPHPVDKPPDKPPHKPANNLGHKSCAPLRPIRPPVLNMWTVSSTGWG